MSEVDICVDNLGEILKTEDHQIRPKGYFDLRMTNQLAEIICQLKCVNGNLLDVESAVNCVDDSVINR